MRSTPKVEIPSTVNRTAPSIEAVQFVLRERERELLVLKGPCSNKSCALHYAHYGPCA